MSRRSVQEPVPLHRVIHGAQADRRPRRRPPATRKPRSGDPSYGCVDWYEYGSERPTGRGTDQRH